MQLVGQVFVNTMSSKCLMNQGVSLSEWIVVDYEVCLCVIKRLSEWIAIDWEVCLSRDYHWDSQSLIGTTSLEWVGTVIGTLGV